MAGTLRQHYHVVLACYLGWTLDAFDFFIMIFVLDKVAAEFQTPVTAVTWAITLTLALRAVGAYLFGRLADRFGRRGTLMANVLIYSVLEFASGFAPNLTVFLIIRSLYGIAMGGEWGVGASLTMESIPADWRGRVSGLLQCGYPTGYLLASVVAYAEPWLGWRGMFMIGALPALLVFYIRRNVPESPDWQNRSADEHRIGMFQVLSQNMPLTIFAVILMTAFNFFSHGTQDLYPRLFLAKQHGFDHTTVSTMLIVYNIGAIVGGLAAGSISQLIGRRRAISIFAALAVPAGYFWMYNDTAVTLAIAGFFMQICVQGAWGVVPAHLNEISPPSIRATFPGLVYQLGNFIASANATIQSSIADHLGKDYRLPLIGVAWAAAVVIAVLVMFGPEGRMLKMGVEREKVTA